MYRGIYIVWRSVSEDQEFSAQIVTRISRMPPKNTNVFFLYLYSFKKKHAHQFVDLEG